MVEVFDCMMRNGTCMGLPQGRTTCEKADTPPEPPKAAGMPVPFPGQIEDWLKVLQSETVPFRPLRPAQVPIDRRWEWQVRSKPYGANCGWSSGLL